MTIVSLAGTKQSISGHDAIYSSPRSDCLAGLAVTNLFPLSLAGRGRCVHQPLSSSMGFSEVYLAAAYLRLPDCGQLERRVEGAEADNTGYKEDGG